MYHLRLIRGLSYSGAVKATREHPDVFTDDKAIADAAVASGYFAIIEFEEPEVPEKEPVPEPPDLLGEAPDYEALSKQTKAELCDYAKEHGIDLTGCKTKADILEAISHAYGGSYTMMELQEER